MNDPIALVEHDPQRDHQIYQCLVSGLNPYDVAVHFGVPLEYVIPIRDELPEFMRKRTMNPALRREIALARTDMAIRALMPAVEKGDHQAIDTMLKVQKREAAMTGLDAPEKTDKEVTIRVIAPWLSSERLSYIREPAAEVVDITPNPPKTYPGEDKPAIPKPKPIEDAVPFVSAKSMLPPVQPGTGAAADAERPPKPKA
jgi:hypothetical protein